MKVVLKQDVAGLGKKGALVNVAEGYARNFLIPKGLCVQATPGVLKDLSHLNQVSQQKQERQLEEARRIREIIHMANVSLSVKAGSTGKLFGSVTAEDIAQAIRKQLKVTVDKRELKLDENLKTLGVHQVKIRLHPEVEAVVNVVLSSS
ncbi:MAG TPA: 50S ribosomal protein L9 [Firmicutes bacterium]|nr:50S ribosomal protein L9 [Bacillota bacterium]